MAITAFGAFSQVTADQIAAQIAQDTQDIDLYVNPQLGSDQNPGTDAAAPRATMAGLNGLLVAGMKIGVLGVLTEEWSTPHVNDISIVGLANWPRQATTSGVPNGGGSTWLSPSGGTGALLSPNGQGWTVSNLYFNNSATAAPCVSLTTEGDPPVDADSSHFQALGCVFTGADDGILCTGGLSFVNLVGNVFFNFAGTGDTAINSATGLGIGTNWGYRIIGNYFYNNVNHIVVPLHNAIITGNTVMVHGLSVTSTKGFDFTNGSGNTVMGNFIEDNLSGAVAAWTGGTNDGWCNFYSDDGVGSGVPA